MHIKIYVRCSIKGNFDHGSLLGFADVYYANGEILRGNFAKGSTLHGVVTRLNKERQIMSVSNYDSGVRSGPSWQMAPEYGVVLYGQADPKDKGKIGGDTALLCYFSNSSDAFALTGKFQDGILQGQGYPKRIAKVSVKGLFAVIYGNN